MEIKTLVKVLFFLIGFLIFEEVFKNVIKKLLRKGKVKKDISIIKDDKRKALYLSIYKRFEDHLKSQAL